MEILLTRDQFRAAVFARDGGKCVICRSMGKDSPGQDAHHILERRLYPDGGYFLSNGAALCGDCHIRAEETRLSVEEIRCACGLLPHPTFATVPASIELPPHLYPDTCYDKWGNPVLRSGQRLRGELYDDVSVQKILSPVLHLFTEKVKYPRTFHLPWSPGMRNEDRMLDPKVVDSWRTMEVVVTEKMDGENTTLYTDYMHERSLDYEAHASRDRVKAMWGRMHFDIPEGWRVCGENLTAKHSIKYERLPHYFQVFSIWNRLVCLSWKDTVEYAALMDLIVVPVLWHGHFDQFDHEEFEESMDFKSHEGYVIRPKESFSLREFPFKVGKYVRKGHVQESHGHWARRRVEFNGLEAGVV